MLAACSGGRRPGTLDLAPGALPVTPEAVEAARKPDPQQLVARRGGDIMLYPADEAAALARQRAVLARKFGAQPKPDEGLPH